MDFTLVNHHESHHLEKYVLLVPGILSKSNSMGGWKFEKTPLVHTYYCLKKPEHEMMKMSH